MTIEQQIKATAIKVHNLLCRMPNEEIACEQMALAFEGLEYSHEVIEEMISKPQWETMPHSLQDTAYMILDM